VAVALWLSISVCVANTCRCGAFTDTGDYVAWAASRPPARSQGTRRSMSLLLALSLRLAHQCPRSPLVWHAQTWEWIEPKLIWILTI